MKFAPFGCRCDTLTTAVRAKGSIYVLAGAAEKLAGVRVRSLKMLGPTCQM